MRQPANHPWKRRITPDGHPALPTYRSLESLWRTEGGDEGGFFVRHRNWPDEMTFMVCRMAADRDTGEVIYLGTMFYQGDKWAQRVGSDTDDLADGWIFQGLSKLRQSGEWRGDWKRQPLGTGAARRGP